MTRPIYILLGVFILAIGVAGISHFPKGGRMLKQIDELKVRITSTTQIPEPTYIVSTGDWYFLDHISGGLAGYDAQKKSFTQVYAESWSTLPNGAHVFKIKSGIKFHDGTPITAQDIIWSIKRHLILKTSTHFPLWDYLVGCENMKTLDEECAGIQQSGPNEITFRLKAQTDSFFSQLASPETGIWAATDMNPKDAKLTPTKFSGPYYVESRNDDYALLKRNSHSPISEKFPNSPRAIRIKRVPFADLNRAVLNKELDLVIKLYSPLGEPDWKKNGIDVTATTASSIIYLFGLGVGDRAPIGKDFIEALWTMNTDKMISAGETFLPFANKYSLTRDEFLAAIPSRTNQKLRILCPDGFFSQNFLDQVSRSAQSVGTEIQYHFVDSNDFFKAFNDPKSSEKYDYIMSIYAASERYPAVQLRYLTKNLVKPPIDLKQTESPDLNIDRIKILKDYQKWLLHSRQATPLYFDATLFLYQKNIDIGDQSTSDAEIELWRVQESVQ